MSRSDSPPLSSPPREELARTHALLLLLLLAGGVALRMATLAMRGSLDMDEQMLAVNILARSAAGLLRALEFEQVAPPLFLLLDRAAVVAVGAGDAVLRAVPLVAGLAVLPLVWLIARVVTLPPPARLLALAVACVSPVLVLYSANAKPYAVDAAVGALLVLLALRVIEAPGVRARWGWLLAAGTVAPLLSLPSVFVLASVGAALVAAPGVRATRDAVRRLAAAAVLWALSFAVPFLALYRPASHDAGLRRFWAGAYLADRLSAARVGDALRYLAEGVATPLFQFGDVVPEGYLLVGAPLLAALGVVWIARRRGAAPALLLAGPSACAAAASAVGQYVMVSRLMLFAAPLTCVALAAGAVAIAGALSGRLAARRAVLAALAVGLTLPPLRHATYPIRHREEMQTAGLVARELLRRAAPDEPVYVYSRAVPAWLLYTVDWEAPDTARVGRLLRVARALGLNSGNTPPRGRPVPADEGRDLVLRDGGRVALIGIPTGMGPDDAGKSTTAPDSGWAEREAARIHAAAAPDVWIYLSHYRALPPQQLLAALRAAGGRETFVLRTAGTQLHRIHFADAAAAAPRQVAGRDGAGAGDGDGGGDRE